MAFKALIPFELFITRVSVSIDEALHTRAVQLDRIKTQKDYCHLVSERARHLRKKHDNSIVRWERWLADIAEELGGENRDLIEKISQEEVYEAGRSTKKIHLIYALHYRLHAEFLYTSYARDIDIQVFGEPFEDKYGKPVFKEIKKSTLGVSYPASIMLDNTYQYGRPEFEETKKCLLSNSSSSLSLTAAIQGVGGYGKTSIAEELCRDEEVKKHFSGGIYWLQFGLVNSDDEERKQAVSFSQSVDNMLQKQFGAKQNANLDFKNDATLAQSLFENLPADNLLIVADDLWNLSQISWLANIPDHIGVLATTRVKSISRYFLSNIEVKSISLAASRKLVVEGLEITSEEQRERIEKISDAFGGWPLLLKLANATFKFRHNSGTDIEDIITSFERFAKLEGVTSWDDPEAGENTDNLRRNLVGNCIEMGLQALGEKTYKAALLSLAVFPEDTDIPFYVITDYWLELTKEKIGSERVDAEKAETIRTRLHDLSFFRDYDPDNKTLRIHDVFLGYFRLKNSKRRLRRLHKSLAHSIKAHCQGNLLHLDQKFTYGWSNILYHLEKAGFYDEANNLRTSYGWLRNKLNAVGAIELLNSFQNISLTDELGEIAKAIKISMPILRHKPQALAHQLYGRLAHNKNDIILTKLTSDAKNDIAFWPVPKKPHLSPLGTEVIRFTTEDSEFSFAIFSPDDQFVLGIVPSQKILVWCKNSGNFISEIDTKALRVSFLPKSKELAIITADGFLEFWQIINQSAEQITSKSYKLFDCKKFIEFSPNGELIALILKDNKVKIISTQNCEIVYQFNATSFHNKIVLSNSCDKALVFSSIGPPHIINFEEVSSEPIVLHRMAQEPSEGVFSLDGNTIFVPTAANNINIFCAKTGEIIDQYQDCGQGIHFHGLSRDGKLLASVSTRGAHVCDISNGRSIKAVPEGLSANSIVFSSDHKNLLTSHRDSIRLWRVPDFASLENQSLEHFFDKKNYPLCYANDLSKSLWTSNGSFGLELKDGISGNSLFKLHDNSSSCEDVAFSHDNTLVASIEYGGDVSVWSADTGKLLLKKLAHNAPGKFISFSSNNAKLLSANENHLIVANLLSGKKNSDFIFYGLEIKFCEFLSDSNRILVGLSDDTIRIYDANDKTELLKISAPLAVMPSATATDILYVMFKNANSEAFAVWDANNHKFIGNIECEGNVEIASVSKDGDIIAISNNDKIISIVDLLSNELLAHLHLDVRPRRIDLIEDEMFIVDYSGNEHVFEICNMRAAIDRFNQNPL